MKYYVTADIHGYFSELKEALAEKGFFEDTSSHKLIICGDLYDRDQEAKALQEFILDLLSNNQVILIRGNHEDLALELLNTWHLKSYKRYHHNANGTVDTVCQLTGNSDVDINLHSEMVGRDFMQSPYIQTIIPSMVDYFETEHYIFTHGWLPSTSISVTPYIKQFNLNPNWRNADKATWNKARWINGMEAAHGGATVEGKTVVCGHWHCSFGHANYEHDGGEFDNNPNFSPYYGDGIIALDACTIRSHKVNCIVIED